MAKVDILWQTVGDTNKSHSTNLVGLQELFHMST